jgi:hypothetical protein
MLASACSVAALLVLAHNGAVLAQSADIPFNGTVPFQANFNGTSPGIAEPTFTVDSNTNTNRYESVTPAIVNVQSSTSATITVTSPRLVSGATPDPAGTSRVAFVRFGSTSFRSDVSGGSATLPPGNTSLEVSMLVERPVAFTPGSYVYAVTLTVTP